jgi:hypothetical protein
VIDYFVIVVTVILVIWLTHLFKLVSQSKSVLSITRQASLIGADKSLSDLEKETQTQQVAKKLMGQFVLVLAGSVGAFLLPMLPLYALSLADLINLDNIFTIMSSVEFIVVFSAIAIIALVKMSRG